LIVDVEDGEAEWNLDVLDLLFDFYFVQPAISAKRKAALNQKLKDAGKPELKDTLNKTVSKSTNVGDQESADCGTGLAPSLGPFDHTKMVDPTPPAGVSCD